MTCWLVQSNIQESLANAKVSARQPWYMRQLTKSAPLRIAQKYQRNLYYGCAIVKISSTINIVKNYRDSRYIAIVSK